MLISSFNIDSAECKFTMSIVYKTAEQRMISINNYNVYDITYIESLTKFILMNE